MFVPVEGRSNALPLSVNFLENSWSRALDLGFFVKFLEGGETIGHRTSWQTRDFGWV